jgi:DNA-binding NarL/FixJ family response regulator
MIYDGKARQRRVAMDKTRVMVADACPVFREGLSRLLEEAGDMFVVAKVADGTAALKLAVELTPDVAVVELFLPGSDAVALSNSLKLHSPDTRVLIISDRVYESHLLAALKAGVRGYLLRTTPIPKLIQTVRLIHTGQSVFDSGAVGRIVESISSGSQARSTGPSNLHARELEILRVVSTGVTYREAALRLNISVCTVHTHMANIFGKLGVRSRPEAVHAALTRGMLSMAELAPGA